MERMADDGFKKKGLSEGWPSASEMMTTEPETVRIGETLSTALGLMRSHGIHELPVMDKGRLAGLLSYDTIGRRHNLSLTTKVEHLMAIAPTVSPRALYPDVAERLLVSDARAACVLDAREGRLLGIVSRTDLTRVAPELSSIAIHPVIDSMNPITTVFHEKDRCDSLFSSLKIPEEHPVPVVDAKNRLVGSVGIHELGEAFWRPMSPGKKDAGVDAPKSGAHIQSIMLPSPPTVDDKTTIGECARLMTHHRTYSVFVVDNDRPVGVVSQTEILSLAVRQRTRVEGTYVQISGLGSGTDPALLSNLDHILTVGLKRIGNVETPVMLTIHLTPHASRRWTDVTVQGRLHTEKGHLYYATRTDWNLLSSVATLMDELERQARDAKRRSRERTRAYSNRHLPSSSLELVAEKELEDRIRGALGVEGRKPRSKGARRA